MSEEAPKENGIKLGDIIRLQSPGDITYDGKPTTQSISVHEITLVNIDGSQAHTLVIEKGGYAMLIYEGLKF